MKADSTAPPLPPGFIEELFSRTSAFFPEGFTNIQKSLVVVVGLGGVGSHAAHMLARSGVGRLRLVDLDIVTLSSLNRHALATLEDVGKSKAEVMKKRIQAIIPPSACQVEAATTMFNQETAPNLLQDQPDFVLDCIDNIPTKSQLLAYCQSKGIRIISSMGAGLKADPTRMCLTELDYTQNEPLGSKLRKKIKHMGQPVTGINVVYSTEDVRGEMLPITDEQLADPDKHRVADKFRIRTLPVLGTMPAIFGNSMAAFVLCELAGRPLQPNVMGSLSRQVKHRLQQHLLNRVRSLYGPGVAMSCKISMQDVELVVREVWGGKCAVTGEKMASGVPVELTRWDATRDPTMDNLVLVKAGLADKLDELGPEKAVPDHTIREKITRRLADYFA